MDRDGNDLEHLPHILTMISHLTKALTEDKSKAATQKPAVSELRVGQNRDERKKKSLCSKAAGGVEACS
ncbi:hypothetical protein E2C01_047055 [Portunus trituberculatus]|uniref:Uncharacterized protein n=1 Tax=Portunus trituberculatus TaxID=210409 RepID=A0A5B7G7R9_PORTR|nr:hypothetical protein [Portunus trituberculatus]